MLDLPISSPPTTKRRKNKMKMLILLQSIGKLYNNKIDILQMFIVVVVDFD